MNTFTWLPRLVLLNLSLFTAAVVAPADSAVKSAVKWCLKLVLDSLGAGNKKRTQIEKKLKDLRKSLKDAGAKALTEYCLARMWRDAFSFQLIQRTYPGH